MGEQLTDGDIRRGGVRQGRPKVGQPLRDGRIEVQPAFLDQAHYSMVKTNTFNGVPLPAIALWNSKTDALILLREPKYSDFLDRLS